MSDLGELDRPGTPASPGAWGACSEGWLLGDPNEPGAADECGAVGERGAVGEARGGNERKAPGRREAADERQAPDEQAAPDEPDVTGPEQSGVRRPVATPSVSGPGTVSAIGPASGSACGPECGSSGSAFGSVSVSVCGPSGSASGSAPVSASASGHAPVSASASGHASVSASASGPAPVSASASGPAPVSASAFGVAAWERPSGGGDDSAEAGRSDAARTLRPTGHRGTADPVKALLHQHRELCGRAVDPLEIAAGLEAHGITDRTAARYRHRDVFSLAEEMYARVPHDVDRPPPPARTASVGRARRVRADWAMRAVLPGVLCGLTLAAVHLTHGRLRLLVAASGVLAVALGVRAALGRGPLSTPPGTHALRPSPRPHAWIWWLFGYALLGDGLLGAVLSGGPDGLPNGTMDGSWPLTAAPVLTLTLACVPAACCARLFAGQARRRLAASRGLKEFTAAVRPLLFGTFALFLCVLTALAALSGAVLHEPAAYPQTLSLGALLLLARLLTVHHLPRPAALALAAAATTEALAPALVLSGRLPGCAFLATPVEVLADDWGPGSVPALACAVAAVVLLLHASRVLTRASAHTPAGERT
jgi:hypothetical protein